MLDKYNRNINYMRISLTDRCNLRCVYCRPNNMQMVEHSEILRYEEILRVAKYAVDLGITRYKITGGEPLVRKGAVDFIAKLKQIHGIEQVTLTTNGMLLEKNLPQLLACKIDGVNISLDTLDKETCKIITGGGDVEAVINATKRAVQLGLKCKLNCVPIKNGFADKGAKVDNLSLHTNQKNVLALIKFAGNLNVPLRFIELMPLACNNRLASYSGSELRQMLQNAGYILEPMHQRLGNGPAIYYKATKNTQSQIIGFIEPLHHKFCGSCNRVRLTSMGQLKPCLYSQSTFDLRQMLRSGADDEEIKKALQLAILQKPMGHHFEEKPANFNMNEIGG